LWLGDPRALPLAGWKLDDGVAYGLTRDGYSQLDEHWSTSPSPAEQSIAADLHLATSGQTTRLGRLLGPAAIRYVVVPLSAAPAATQAPSYPPPPALLDALGGQLDLRRVDVDDALVVYENQSWIPERASLSPSAAAASQEAGAASLVQADVSGSTPVLTPASKPQTFTGTVPAGSLYFGSTDDGGWHLDVGGQPVPRRAAFGWANAFDVPTAGKASMAFDTAASFRLALVFQAALWIAAIAFVWRGLVPSDERRARRRARDRARHAAAHDAVLDAERDAPVLIATGEVRS
jgi:hypothetical protein